MPTVRWLGHSAFEIRSEDHTLLIDPFLTDNPAATVTAADLSPDVILLTHGHGDHVGDAIDIARRTGALVIANFEIGEWLGRQGITNCHGMSLGGQHQFKFGTVRMTLAHHGSMLPDGSYGGNPAGLLLTLDGRTVYHAGDTALFSDMQLIGEHGIDLAILPIGDNYTMGPEDSVRATKFLNPRRVLPCHYNTWPLIAQDAQAWSAAIRRDTLAEPVVLQPGESRKV
ncbi:metal-dependent hydrolase [Maioricimonas sp. JC845]|uniref:metal-dependent hydrolase n=1 Tax=Maioricimonas sp. JC845 TaxID=3232138 RepID=UPI00345A806A